MDKGQRDQSRLSTCRLYLISPPRIAPTDFSGVLKDALKGGDVASFQLRLKHVSDDEIRRATDTLRPIVQAAGAAFILNDRPDLAAELGCDGVLMNTAIAGAQDPIRMARAMKLAVEAGREAFLAGRIPRKFAASPSSPMAGRIA